MKWMLGAALSVLVGFGAMAQAPLGGASKDGAPAAGKPAETVAPAAPVATQQCPDNAAAYANSNESFACLCPPEAMAAGSVWGSDIYTADSGLCRAAQHAGVISRRGGPVTVQMLPGQPRYLGLTRNGVQSQNYGAYDSSFRFDGGRPAAEATAGPQDLGNCPDNLSAFAGETGKLTCSCEPAAIGQGSVWGSDIYTADSGTCRAAVHAGAIRRGGGQVMIQMLPGQPRYIGMTRNGVQSQNYGAYDSSFRFDSAAGQATAPAAPAPAPAAAAPTAQAGPTRMAQCPDNMSAFENSDETVVCGCSALAVAQSSAIWGSDTYTSDSAPCRAALHAGAVGRQGGEVTITMLPGEARYMGVTRNGVQSQPFGPYRWSFRFAGVQRAAGPDLCPDNMTSLDGSDEGLTCLCPGDATARGSVWGSDVYTSDSGTCRAAVHAGVIGQGGGTVTLRMLPGQPRYLGITRNGVPSQNYGAYRSSFRFEGGQRAQGNVPMQAPVAASLQRSGQVQLYVTFRTGLADLDITAAPILMQVRDAMAADPSLRLRLIGHTDSQGSAQTNIPLSIRRAEAVRMWLAQAGIAPDRLLAEGRGQTEPIADNGSEAGRALNRRVQAVRLQ